MTTRRQRTAPVVVYPDRAGHDRMLQQLVNKYHNEIKDLKTDWKTITNRFGDIVTIVPMVHMEFKDGTDYVVELSKATAPVYGNNNGH